MARPLRLEEPGAVWHVTARGNDRMEIFRDDADRTRFLELLGRVVDLFRWDLHAYVLMGNHYHLLLTTPEPTLSRGMRQLNGVYTQAFNRRHGRTGHVLQGRFHAVRVQREGHLLELARYVVLNPVRAGIASSAAAWRWSSYRATAGLARAPRWLDARSLLETFVASRTEAERRYRRFVSEGRDAGYDPWGQIRGQIYLGDEAFAASASRREAPRGDPRSVPRAQRRPVMPSADEVVARAERVLGASLEEMKARPRVFLEARRALAAALRRARQASLAEIGRVLGVREAQASSLARAGEKSSATHTVADGALKPKGHKT